MAGLRAIAGHLAAACVLVSAASGATIVVDLQGGGDFTSIQPAIDAAKSGDTVLVNPGEYVIAEPINFKRLHNPDDPASPPVNDMVVKSEGGPEVTIRRMEEPVRNAWNPMQAQQTGPCAYESPPSMSMRHPRAASLLRQAAVYTPRPGAQSRDSDRLSKRQPSGVGDYFYYSEY
jgi:hypothetical protein